MTEYPDRAAVQHSAAAPITERALDHLLWPLLFGLCLWATAHAFASPQPLLGFNAIYLSLAIVLLVLERWRPHSEAWRRGDGQTFANLAHTLLNKGLVQLLVVFAGIFGLSQIAPSLADTTVSRGLWPGHWPLPWQVVLALPIAEFGLYWVHRLGHEWPWLWRFHFVDSLLSVIVGTALVALLGASLEVLLWVSAITAYVGILTHCNVRMRNRWLSRLFNTPGLHRWHHSRNPREGNSNYGENLMFWDLLFGTFHYPERRPPENIGIDEPMSASFLGQLAHPFRGRAVKATA